MMTFGRRLAANIRACRVAAEMTQAELAQRIGVTCNAVSNYENARREPGLETMSMMAAALGVEVGDIVPHVEPNRPMACRQTTIYDILERL